MIPSPSPLNVQAPVEFTPEQRQALSYLSPAHMAFVEHACNSPAFLDKAQFRSLEEKHCSLLNALQPWPTLIGESAISDMARITTGLSRAIKRIPEEIFALDAEAISEFFHLNLDFVRHFILPSISDQVMDGLIGRGDFLLGAEKLWCVEFNMSVSLGGIWEATKWDRMARSNPLIAGYLRENNLHVRPRNSLRLMMRHVIREAKRYLKDLGGAVNVAYVLAKTNIETVDEVPQRAELRDFFQQEYQEVLKESNDRGEFILCTFEDLWTENGRVFLGDLPINVILEMTTGDVPLHILRCYQRGTVNLHNGAVTYLLCNKMAMALLSEFHDSGIFPEEEAELIRTHVPWTRKVADTATEFKGVSVILPEFMRDNQKELVLKKGLSASGQHVVVGRHSTPEEWEAGLKLAFDEGDWTVQEYIRYPQLPYQDGTYGYCLHDVVFGLFVFGNEFGGEFMRVLAKDRGGIVNRQKGCLDAIALEIF